MSEDAYELVLMPVVRDLFQHLNRLVLIGGWVPELHRRFGGHGDWAVKPLKTMEVDILVAGSEEAGPLASALESSGFVPVGESGVSAVWERDVRLGERIEFFVAHAGVWEELGTVDALDAEARLGGLRLSDMGVLRDRSVTLSVPVDTREGRATLINVRVPEIGAFLIQKGATFRRRPDSAKAAKDLHYVVDVMQSSEALVEAIERQIAAYCEEGTDAAELARRARNHLGVFIRESSTTDVRTRLAGGLSERHSLTQEAADARAVGFLTDFRDLIPEGCGRRGTTEIGEPGASIAAPP
jgi:hypothetical protein